MHEAFLKGYYVKLYQTLSFEDILFGTLRHLLYTFDSSGGSGGGRRCGGGEEGVVEWLRDSYSLGYPRL